MSQQKLNNASRLEALKRTRLLDSDPEVTFDRITQLACDILNAPMGLVTLVEPHRQFFKSQVGLPEPFASQRETPLEYSFCQHVITSGNTFVVPNALEHPLVCDSPAIEEMNVIAYLGMPLVSDDGWHLGAFCIIDNKPHEWTEHDIQTMETLATSVQTEIQLRLDMLVNEELLAQLEDRNQQLDAFSHTVSHNLKNAINSILGWAEIGLTYESKMNRAELLETLSKVKQSALQSNETLKALLLLSEVNLTADIVSSEINMDTLINKALVLLEPQIIATQANIILPDDFPVCIGYAPWLEEVWVNYISNALKYGGTPPVINITATIHANQQQVTYWIKDNGAGIAQDDQATLFKTFSRLAQTITVEGHGLGLAIVKRIADKLDGQVGVESELGHGSTFYITLPYAQDE